MKLLSLGAGNMASALLGPIVKSFDQFSVYSPGQSASHFAEKFHASEVSDISLFDSKIDILVLSFKPQVFDEASDAFLKEFKQNLNETVVVSMLAGTPLEVISKKYKTKNIVRIMPNTPAKVGHGITLFLGHEEADKGRVEQLKKVLMQTGEVIQAKDEDQFDQWTAVTGSGPAYLFEYARIFEAILVKQGMAKNIARLAVRELFVGSSLMMKESDESYEQLRENVTSKKGVTYEALEVFKEAMLESIVAKAVEANISRSSELKRVALGKDN